MSVKDVVREFRVTPKTNVVDLIFEVITLTDAMKNEVKDKTIADKKLLAKFAMWGMGFMFISMLLALTALGVVGEPVLLDWTFFAKFIGSVFASIGLAWFVGKIKEVVMKFVDPEKAMAIVKDLVKKISP